LTSASNTYYQSLALDLILGICEQECSVFGKLPTSRANRDSDVVEAA